MRLKSNGRGGISVQRKCDNCGDHVAVRELRSTGYGELCNHCYRTQSQILRAAGQR